MQSAECTRHDGQIWIEGRGLVAAAIDVDVAAAEEDVHGLANAVQEIIGRGVDGADALEFGLDEEGSFAVQGLGVVSLALLLGAGNGPAFLADVKTRGCGVLGQGTLAPKYSRTRDVALTKLSRNPEKLLRVMVQYRIARDA